MATNRSLQPKSETIIVASANSALATSGVLVPATGNALNLADGQIAVVSDSRGANVPKGTFLDAGDLVADAPVVRIVQGTPNSSDLRKVGNFSQTGHKAFVESAPIDGKNTLSFTGKIAALPSFNTHVIGDAAANAGAITVLDEQVYELNVGFVGTRHDKYFSSTGKDSARVSFETPDYSVLAPTNSLDHLVQNLCFNGNLYSSAMNMGSHKTFGNKPFVMFAVSSTAVSGVALSAITAGTTTSVPFMTHSGVTYNFEFGEAEQAAIADVVANSVLATTATIVPINRSTAGSALNADVILVMALDVEEALVDDRVKEVKVALEIGYAEGFNAATNINLNKQEPSLAYEGIGSGRNWLLQYRELAGNQVWSQQVRPHMNFMIEPPVYIDPTLDYSAFILEHYEDFRATNEFTDRRFHRTIILIPADASAGTTSNATLLTSLNAILSPWLDSVADAGRMERTETPATLPAYFV